MALHRSAPPCTLLSDLHVGSGLPDFRLQSDFPELVQRGDSEECIHSSCASVCSAASTVVSAMFSIEGSISFPTTSEQVLGSVSICSVRWPVVLELDNCSRKRKYEQDFHARRCSIRKFDSFNIKYTPLDACSEIEEYSIGSGNPFQGCSRSSANTRQFGSLPKHNKS